MPVNRLAIKKLRELFDPEEVKEILKMSKETEDFEAHWRHLLTGFFNGITEEVINKFINAEPLKESDLPFDDFFMKHFFEATRNAFHQTQSPTAATIGRLAKIPKGKIPKSLNDLMKIWDKYRKSGQMPPHQRTIVNRVRRDYLNKVKSVWEKYSEPFRTGDNQDKQDIVDRIRRASHSQYARSKTIVETETTRYYNQVRKEIYDQSPDVTHYLFMAIRDMRTTKWCKTRHEVVYTKDTEVFSRETPPIHWNCRSEILPLTPLNPRHKKIIDDQSKRRENRHPEPLPKGWVAG